MQSHTRQQLIEAVCNGAKPKYHLFWGHTPGRAQVGPWVFSQWYEGASFLLDGIDYPTAEHYMMAGKASVMGDTRMLARIRESEHPGDAKKLGRMVTPWDDAKWKAARFRIVVEGNVAKFGQNPALREFLLDTNDQVLVEAAPRDRIWGIGLGAKNPRSVDPVQWRGQNLLGFALMEARDRLRFGGG